MGRKVRPESNIKRLTYKKDPPLSEFLISRAAILNIQQSASLQMNASSHMDWLLIAINKLVTELQAECDEEDPRLKAIQELLYATAYANEFVTDQSVYIHSGFTNLMREHHLEQMIGIEPEEYNDLILQPYYGKSVFNGETDKIIKEKQQRDNTAAMSRFVSDRSPPPPPQPKKSDLLQRLANLKQKITSTKARKEKAKTKEHKKKKGFPKSHKKERKWKTNNHNNSTSFPANSFHRKKTKKGGFKPKSGGRDRDFY